jgi:hypothetical protein
VAAKWRVIFEYTFDLVPLELVVNEPDGPEWQENGVKLRNVYGFGIWPGGIKFMGDLGQSFYPFAGINGGIVAYSQPVPFDGRRLNFTGNFDTGVLVRFGRSQSLTIAYKYHHVSNGYTADRNVGTNVNMLMIGYSVFR